MNVQPAQQAMIEARLAERQGRLEEARRHYGRAIAGAPRDAPLLVEASVIEGRLDNLKGAERLLLKALKLDPANADIYYNLGQVARQEEQLERATRMFRRSVELDPTYEEAAFALGEALYVQGLASEALTWLERAAAAKPNDPEIRHVLALTLDHLGRIPAALAAYREVLRLDPGHDNAMLNLAVLTAQSADPLESIDLVNRMEAEKRIRPEHYSHVAKVLNIAGENERSLKYAELAVAEGGDVLDAANTRANILIDFGDFDEAEKELRKILNINRDSVHAYYRLSVIKRLDRQAEKILRRHSQNERMTAVERSNAYFALFHLLDRAGEYDDAFEMLRLGNELKGGRVPFDIRRHDEQADRVMATYTPEFIESRRGQGYDGLGGIQVGGMPRSGTTLTEQILAAHPLVHAGGESLNVATIVRREPNWPASALDASPETLRQQGKDIHEALFRDAEGKPFATDKTPANYAFFGALACLLPGIKLVYVRRQPGDNAMSLYEQSFLRGLGYSYDLASIGAVYRTHQRVMDHWINVCRLPIHTVDYDALVQDPEPHIRALLDFAGLDFHPDCLTPNRVERAIKTSSVWQVRQPINAKSVGRWRRYERQMQPFLRALEGVQ